MAGQTWESESVAYLVPRPAGRGDAWAEEASRGGGRGMQRLLEVRELVPPEDVGVALGLETGECAVVRRRVMYLDERPVELTDSYYPATVARGTRLAEARKIPGGAVTFVAELGHAIREVVEDVAVDLPAPEARDVLQLAAGEPVLVLTRTSMTADLLPVEVSRMVMPRGHRLRYRTRVG
ncbi:UTRA domain-containing protein [Streptomyces sp. B6B3]|uniref:UTRA domain-containing protein n=1 Tax=Streptomyces sp. B6B3 TaxID=3153570 RepID=UPI00325E80A6